MNASQIQEKYTQHYSDMSVLHESYQQDLMLIEQLLLEIDLGQMWNKGKQAVKAGASALGGMVKSAVSSIATELGWKILANLFDKFFRSSEQDQINAWKAIKDGQLPPEPAQQVSSVFNGVSTQNVNQSFTYPQETTLVEQKAFLANFIVEHNLLNECLIKGVFLTEAVNPAKQAEIQKIVADATAKLTALYPNSKNKKRDTANAAKAFIDTLSQQLGINQNTAPTNTNTPALPQTKSQLAVTGNQPSAVVTNTNTPQQAADVLVQQGSRTNSRQNSRMGGGEPIEGEFREIPNTQAATTPAAKEGFFKRLFKYVTTNPIKSSAVVVGLIAGVTSLIPSLAVAPAILLAAAAKGTVVGAGGGVIEQLRKHGFDIRKYDLKAVAKRAAMGGIIFTGGAALGPLIGAGMAKIQSMLGLKSNAAAAVIPVGDENSMPNSMPSRQSVIGAEGQGDSYPVEDGSTYSKQGKTKFEIDHATEQNTLRNGIDNAVRAKDDAIAKALNAGEQIPRGTKDQMDNALTNLFNNTKGHAMSP